MDEKIRILREELKQNIGSSVNHTKNNITPAHRYVRYCASVVNFTNGCCEAKKRQTKERIHTTESEGKHNWIRSVNA